MILKGPIKDKKPIHLPYWVKTIKILSDIRSNSKKETATIDTLIDITVKKAGL